MAAIFMGSAAGAVMGGAYLTATGAHRATPAAVASATAPLAPPPFTAVVRSGQTGHAAANHPAPIVAAKPFRFADVAGGATDLQCLTEAVYFEARGEPEQGQKAVAQVILNRVRHPAFPKTICGVVHQRTAAGCQFSFACAVEPHGRDQNAWKRARTIADAAMNGAVMRQIGDATHFESVRAVAFAGLLKVAQIGEHVFYRFGGRNGSAGMFHQTPAPSTAPRVMVASLTAAEPAALTVGAHATPASTATDAAVAAKVIPVKAVAVAAASSSAPAIRAAAGVAPVATPSVALVPASTAAAPSVAKPTATTVAVAS